MKMRDVACCCFRGVMLLLGCCIVILLFGILLLGCAAPSEPELPPTVTQDPGPRIGYWHSDGAQTLCEPTFCYTVYADVEVRADSTCDYHWAAQGAEQWATWSAVYCRVNFGESAVRIFSTGHLEYPGTSTDTILNFTLYRVDPMFDEVMWDDLLLIRREP